MTPQTRQRRERILAGLATMAGVLLLMALVQAVSRPPQEATHPRTGTAVFPDGERVLDAARIIEVTLADGGYRLVRGAQGWAMDTADGFPLRADRLATLAEGVRSLEWGEARTRDPRKFDRLGLGDPREDGAGALVTILDGEGRELAALITGRRNDGIYARRPEEDVAFRLRGELPPFYARAAWMDLAVIELAAETVRAVRIEDERGERLLLARAPGDGPRAFRPAPPHENDRLVNPLAAAGPGLALSRFAPIDVKPADALSTQPLARHVTMTHDGLEVDVRAFREVDGRYVTLRAVEAGEGAARAAAINRRAEGWAFELNRTDWRDFATPVRSIVERPLIEDP